jgi:hypothetical protein
MPSMFGTLSQSFRHSLSLAELRAEFLWTKANRSRDRDAKPWISLAGDRQATEGVLFFMPAKAARGLVAAVALNCLQVLPRHRPRISGFSHARVTPSCRASRRPVTPANS